VITNLFEFKEYVHIDCFNKKIFWGFGFHGIWIVWLLSSWNMNSLIAEFMEYEYFDYWVHGIWILWLLSSWNLNCLIVEFKENELFDCWVHGIWIHWLFKYNIFNFFSSWKMYKNAETVNKKIGIFNSTQNIFHKFFNNIVLLYLWDNRN
jgi:hypothetical protein